MRQTIAAAALAAAGLLLPGCGGGGDSEALAAFEEAASDPGLSMRERASRMRAAGRQADSAELSAASREAADRADDFASSIEASQRLVKRREDSFAADMAESFLRGTSGDVFGKPREVMREASAMDRRVAAAEEGYIEGVDGVVRVAEREGIEASGGGDPSAEAGGTSLGTYAFFAFLLYATLSGFFSSPRRTRRRGASAAARTAKEKARGGGRSRPRGP